MPKRTSDFREDLLADLADPSEAARYLNAAMEDSEQMLLVALRDVADSRQMSRVAENAGVAREALYRMLAQNGNPTYTNLMAILSALGVRLEFAPIDPGLAERTLREVETLSSGQKRAGYRRPIKVQSNSRRRAAAPSCSRQGRSRSSGKTRSEGARIGIGAMAAQSLAFAS